MKMQTAILKDKYRIGIIGNGIISGFVSDFGASYDNCVVMLYSDAGRLVGSVVPKNGSYSFSGLPFGACFFVVARDQIKLKMQLYQTL